MLVRVPASDKGPEDIKAKSEGYKTYVGYKNRVCYKSRHINHEDYKRCEGQKVKKL